MPNERSSTKIDKYVGTRIKSQREKMGLSQEKLADYLGISFQQVQKYERGFNRVGASRLYDISLKLEQPISYFFEGLENIPDNYAPDEVAFMLFQHRAVELLQNYSQSPPDVQKKIFALVEVMKN